MYYERKLAQTLRASKKSILLLGPRQTGKSTLIQSLKPTLEINLADEATFVRFLRDPSLLRQAVRGHTSIFIDEVQRLPSLLNTTQALIDADKSLRFLLTGSSASKLKRGKANLLPGRILSYELGPLCAAEVGDSLDIQKALSIGLLPGIYSEPDPATAQKFLRTYSITYLKEEIQAEALTRNLEGFSRFFQIIASRSGDFVDFSKFSSQAHIERTSASRYFETLIDTLILTPVEAFAKSSRKRLTQHPRFYFFDVGVLNGTLENFAPSADRIGALFEHLVLQLLSSGAKALDQTVRISVYRTDAGAEVDFIVEKENDVFAIEVKATRTIGVHDLRGLKSFAEFYGKKHHPMIIYLGEDVLHFNKVPILPLRKAMETIFSEI